jgi:hypothetical protein
VSSEVVKWWKEMELSSGGVANDYGLSMDETRQEAPTIG